MRSDRVRLQLWAFILLTGGFAANIFILQSNVLQGWVRGNAPGKGIETASLPPFSATSGSLNSAVVVGPDEAAAEAGAASDLDPEAQVTRAVQRELQARGYDTGALDGRAGVVTRAAIMGFEYDHGLPLTGKPGEDLLKSILLGAEQRPVKATRARIGSTEAELLIKSVQKSLTERGYKPGAASGQLTPATMSAIREFEVDQSLPETGRISGPLVVRLARASAPVAARP
jgi:peptidoglycan hydrolase-like protein with peptidoglycan-binding domain